MTLPQREGITLQLLSGGAAQGIVGAIEEDFRLATGALRAGHVRRRRCDARQAHRRCAVRRDHSDRAAHRCARSRGHVWPGTAAPLGRVRGPESPCAQANRCPRSPTAPRCARPFLPRRGSTSRPGARHGRHPLREAVLRELGIHDAVAPRLHPFPNGAAAMREARSLDGTRTRRLYADHRDSIHAGRRPGRPASRRLRTFDGLHGRSVQQRGGARACEAPRRNVVPGPATRCCARPPGSSKPWGVLTRPQPMIAWLAEARRPVIRSSSMDRNSNIADEYPLPKRRVRWVGLIFFIVLHVIGLIGTPLYIYYRGITGPGNRAVPGLLRGDRPVDHHRLPPPVRALRVQGARPSCNSSSCSSARRRSRNPR